MRKPRVLAEAAGRGINCLRFLAACSGARLELSGGQGRTYRLGSRLDLGPSTRLSVEGGLSERDAWFGSREELAYELLLRGSLVGRQGGRPVMIESASRIRGVAVPALVKIAALGLVALTIGCIPFVPII